MKSSPDPSSQNGLPLCILRVEELKKVCDLPHRLAATQIMTSLSSNGYNCERNLEQAIQKPMPQKEV